MGMEPEVWGSWEGCREVFGVCVGAGLGGRARGTGWGVTEDFGVCVGVGPGVGDRWQVYREVAEAFVAGWGGAESRHGVARKVMWRSQAAEVGLGVEPGSRGGARALVS